GCCSDPRCKHEC
uniref:Alpha-conotoxin-like Reg1d n=1 Tax=Conus regius TaxID=101314 RepID=CA1D_CONRE|nr:RecName: Full=Alpha-conotoxin-like Reg1d [Conus regius]